MFVSASSYKLSPVVIPGNYYYWVLSTGLLGLGQQEHSNAGAGHQNKTACTEHPGAGVTGLGQVKAGGVDHLQRSFCIIGVQACKFHNAIAVGFEDTILEALGCTTALNSLLL